MTQTDGSMKQDEPLLMIEGDEFFVNHDGICRTFYELERWNHHHGNCYQHPLSLEEEYDLKRARKTFTLRNKTATDTSNYNTDNDDDTHIRMNETNQISILSKRAQGIVSLGRLQHQIHIQEIDQGVFGSAGTGATTWESSIAMALLTSSQPQLLQGHVLELGSGVGLGGILVGTLLLPSSSILSSLTLTDGNEQVLEACRYNCRLANKLDHSKLNIQRLDWNELPHPTPTYDTILVSDCAYKYPDVLSLAVTCKACLRNPGGTIHIFGPYNRGGLQDLLVELRDGQNMTVEVNGIEMNRYRLQSSYVAKCVSSPRQQGEDEAAFASRHTVQFLHAIVTHGNPNDDHSSHGPSSSRMGDID